MKDTLRAHRFMCGEVYRQKETKMLTAESDVWTHRITRLLSSSDSDNPQMFARPSRIRKSSEKERERRGRLLQRRYSSKVFSFFFCKTTATHNNMCRECVCVPVRTEWMKHSGDHRWRWSDWKLIIERDLWPRRRIGLCSYFASSNAQTTNLYSLRVRLCRSATCTWASRSKWKRNTFFVTKNCGVVYRWTYLLP